MDDPRDRRRPEPRGYVPQQPPDVRRGWRTAVDWLLGTREQIDQEGLLIERPLLGPPDAESGSRPDRPDDAR